MNATQIAELFARLQAARPQPTTELDYRSPFELLVAVILSAQSTDKKVVTTNVSHPSSMDGLLIWKEPPVRSVLG